MIFKIHSLFSLFMILSINILLISCASTLETSAVPDWVADYHAVYLSEEYLLGAGESATKDGSRIEAAASFSRFLKTEIQTQTLAENNAFSDGSSTTIQRTLSTETNLKSSVTISNIEYTEPFYFKKRNVWYCVAYLEREKAWEQYKPTVEKTKTEFYSFYKKACDESDSFIKCALLRKSVKAGEDFLEKLDFARILNAKKEAVYSDDRKTVSEIPVLIVAEKEKCTVCLSVTGDWGSIISSSLSQTLAKNGFKIAKSRSEANYTANAVIETNASGSEPISVNPVLDLKIESSAGKTLYAVQVKSEKKTLAYTLENAQKKAYPILAEESEKVISAGLTETIGNE